MLCLRIQSSAVFTPKRMHVSLPCPKTCQSRSRFPGVHTCVKFWSGCFVLATVLSRSFFVETKVLQACQEKSLIQNSDVNDSARHGVFRETVFFNLRPECWAWSVSIVFVSDTGEKAMNISKLYPKLGSSQNSKVQRTVGWNHFCWGAVKSYTFDNECPSARDAEMLLRSLSLTNYIGLQLGLKFQVCGREANLHV